MKLSPTTIDPSRLMKPTSVARRLHVHASMVTHWMESSTLDFVVIDEVKFIPEENVAVLEALRQQKADERAERKGQTAPQGQFVTA